MRTRRIVVMLLFVVVASATTPAGGVPWDKAPEQWTLADVFRILQDSPWSPSKFSLEANYQQRRTDPQTEVVGDSRVQAKYPAVVPGVTLSRGHALPAVTVLWWSSKTIRLAEAKRLASRTGSAVANGKIATAEMPDYVLTVEGDEPQRILRDAKEDLHDTVFLELENGGTLDLTAVRYIDGTDSDAFRTEIHFSRTLNGSPAIDPESQRVIFHCRANAKKEMQNRENALSFRVEFSPRQMKARGQPDL
jgi:hypothetical protein